MYYDLGFVKLCSYGIKMDENGAQESGMDLYAQFNQGQLELSLV